MADSPCRHVDTLDRAIQLSNLRHEIEVNSFYHAATLCEQDMPLDETARLAEAKRRLIDDVLVVAPLAVHIVRGSRIACEAVDDPYARAGAVTCFRVHEILRKTRSHPEARIVLNDTPIAREELLAWYRMLVPNTNLEPLSKLTLFTMPRILLTGLLGGVVIGGLAGRQQTPPAALDFEAGLFGAALVAAVMTLLGQFALSRNILKTAPWNAAIYDDINLALFRRDPGLLYLARREYMDRNQCIKGGVKGRRYHERAQAVENGSYIDVLRRHRDLLLGR
jgi:hypothetical protein